MDNVPRGRSDGKGGADIGDSAPALPFPGITTTFNADIVRGILITGATGFVGSHLVEAVARNGLRARALVRPTSDIEALERHGIDPVVGDIMDPASLRSAVAEADTVLHLAAATRALGPAGFRRVNVEGTRHLVDAMTAVGGGQRLVYLSSLAAAGPSGDRPKGRDDTPAPITAYGRSKLEGERAALDAEGISAAALRAPAVYGPRDRDLLTFFQFADRGLLPMAGPRDRRLQLIHVHDLVEAILSAARARSATGVYHVAEPQSYTWTEVLDLVADAVGRPGRRIPVPPLVLKAAAAATEAVARIARRPAIFDRDKAREILAPGWLCETEAARNAFMFEAATPLAAGLRETARWYREHGWLTSGRGQR